MNYSTIYIYETNFQKRIIDNIIQKELLDNSFILLVDARLHKLCINENEYVLNFNKIESYFKSIMNLKVLMRLKCKTLVSTHFTGVNALFFSAFIKSEQKVLIDDGIGTSVFMKTLNIEINNPKYKIKLFLIKYLCWFYGRKFRTINENKKTIYKYFTIYPFEKKNDTSYEIVYLTIFPKINNSINKSIFIGSPLIEFGKLTKMEMLSILQKTKQEIGPFEYYLHPDEKTLEFEYIEGVKIKRYPLNLEEMFYSEGLPETVVGFPSTILLNLRIMKGCNIETNLFYIKQRIYRNKLDEMYYSVLSNFNIKELKYIK